MSNTKIGLQKAWVWIKKYWYIPVIALVAVVTFIVAKGNAAWFWKIFDDAVESHKREVDAIDEAHNEEIKKREEALKRYEETIREIEEEYQKEGRTLESKKRKEVKKYVDMYNEDPDELARVIEERFGIRYVE